LKTGDLGGTMNLLNLIGLPRSDARPLDVSDVREAERQNAYEWVFVVAGVPAALIVLAISYTFWGAVTGWSSLSDTWQTLQNLLPEVLQSPMKSVAMLVAALTAILVAVFAYRHLGARKSRRIRREFLDRYEVFRKRVGQE
jgi:hypothetical protein